MLEDLTLLAKACQHPRALLLLSTLVSAHPIQQLALALTRPEAHQHQCGGAATTTTTNRPLRKHQAGWTDAVVLVLWCSGAGVTNTQASSHAPAGTLLASCTYAFA